jgi:hypothetical protein
VLATSYENEPLLESFFSGLLRIKDTSVNEVLAELEKRSTSDTPPTSHAVANEIYTFLNTNASSDEWQELRYVDFVLLLCNPASPSVQQAD